MLRSLNRFLTPISFIPFRFSSPLYQFSYGKDDKISWSKKINEESHTNEYQNPFFNPQAAGLKSQMNQMQAEIKNWQEAFKKKNGRKPTLDEMKSDPTIGPMLKSFDQQRHAIQAAIQRFRIN